MPPSFLRFAVALLASTLLLPAQMTITYTDGLVRTAAIDTSAPNSPTTLSLASGSATQSGDISGTGSLVKSGAGTLILSGTNTYTGSTTISAGALALGASDRLADSSAVSIASGATLSLGLYSDTVGSLAGAGTLALGFGSLTAGSNNTSTIFSGVISGVGGLIKSGSGELTLSGANTYSGPTTISSGSLALGASNVLSNSTALTIASGATFYLDGYSETVGSLAGGGNVYFVGTGTLTTGGDNTSTTFSGALSGAGHFYKTGSGTLTLSGANSHSGPTTVSAGTLALGASDRLADTTAVTIVSGATFDLADHSDTIGSLAGAGNVTLGAGTLTAGRDNTSTTFSGMLSGTGHLTKAGSGELTLSGANSYSGGTTNSAGSLVGNTTSLQGDIVNNASLTFNQTTDGTYSGVLSGYSFGGAVFKTGSGTLTLSGANTYSGATIIDGGTLKLGASDRIADASALTVNSLGVFDLAGYSEGVFSLGGNGRVFLGAGTLTISGNDNTSFFGAISGSGSLTKSGSGTLTLRGANTYSGTTTVSAGTLALGAGGTLASSSEITVSSGATLNLAGFTQTLGSLSGSGQVTLGSGTLSIGAQNTTTTFAGIVSGTGSITKTGSGTLTLSGANTYAGGTTIAAGTLTGDSTSLQGAIANQAVLIFDQSATGTYSGVISGSGSLTKAGAGTLALSGTNTYSGGTTLNAGLINFAALANFGTGSLTLNGGGLQWASGNTLDASSRLAALSSAGGTFDTNGNNVTLASVVSGTGGLTKIGTGTLTLTAANTYTGGTLINAGTLVAAHHGEIGTFQTGSTITVNTGATLVATASDSLGWGSGNANLIINGGTVTTDTSTGQHTTLQYVTMTGGLLTSAATDGRFLLNGPLVTTASSSTAIINAPYLDLLSGWTSGVTTSFTVAKGTTASGIDLDIAAAVIGTGPVIKLGPGTLRLTGANTYTGATSVNAGTLLVNGSLANSTVSVASGATLGGSGSIAGPTTLASGAHLAPGNSPGTLTFSNGLTLNQGAILDFQLGTISDLIAVTGGTLTGPGTLGGVTLNLSNAGGFTAGTYTLINYATASGTASFGADRFTVGTTIAGYAYAFTDTGSALQLTATAVPEPATYAALAGIAALGLAASRRRRITQLQPPGAREA